MAYLGQPLNTAFVFNGVTGWFWSGTKVCGHYIDSPGSTACWEYTRAPDGVFSSAAPNPYQPPVGPPQVAPEPIYQPPPVTTGGSGSTPAPTDIAPPAGDCGCSDKSTTPGGAVSAAPGAGPGAPGAPGGPAVAGETLSGYPWWVWVLGLLVLAGVVHE